MQSIEETKPRRSDVFPEEDENTGPGCIIWGIVAVFGLLLSIAIVLTAAEAGVRQGAAIGERTAVARTQAFIVRECENLPDDIANSRISILQRRFDNWTQQGEIPSCAQAFIPQATQVYIDSLATDTPMPSPTLEPTLPPTATPTVIVEATSASVPVENPTATSLYDLAALLQEARDSMAVEDYQEAIRTLDAITAIDPNFETGTVNQLLFTALTNRATRLYRTDGSLAEAIQLTNRAQNYGDVQDLAFERSVAQYYLDAQGFLDVNYPAAIQQLNLVRSFATNYRDTNSLLVEQLVGYAESLLEDGDACRAVAQYDAALAIQAQPSIQTQRSEAQNLCSGTGSVASTAAGGATSDPDATQDPSQPTQDPSQPTQAPPTATSGIAPVGQPGG